MSIPKEIKDTVKAAVLEHLEKQDSLRNLPEIMSLKEAHERTTISVSAFKKYADEGIISLTRIGTGRGKMMIKRSELMKLITEL